MLTIAFIILFQILIYMYNKYNKYRYSKKKCKIKNKWIMIFLIIVRAL
jgi:hypothetical protein